LAERRSFLSQQWRADGLLLAVTLIWGSTFVMVKQSVEEFPLFAFLALRFSLATVVLLLLFGRRLHNLPKGTVAASIWIGLFLFGGYAFQTAGLRLTSASKAGFITGLSVVIVPVMSAVVLKRRPRANAIVGAVLAVAGLGLLTLGPDVSPGFGDLIVLACAFCFALHIISVSKYAPRSDALALTTLQVGVVALLSAVASLACEGIPAPVPGSTLAAAAFTGVMATAVAFGVQNSVQAFTTPTHTALVFAAEPVFAAVFGFALGGDRLTSLGLLGCGLILAGMLVAEIRPKPDVETPRPEKEGEKDD
jgi:drug/metabolite transporter (DMT)-like permease